MPVSQIGREDPEFGFDRLSSAIPGGQGSDRKGMTQIVQTRNRLFGPTQATTQTAKDGADCTVAQGPPPESDKESRGDTPMDGAVAQALVPLQRQQRARLDRDETRVAVFGLTDR